MATSFENIYSVFFSQIDDIEIAKLSLEDTKEFLYDHLRNSVIEFKKCKKDLTKYEKAQSGTIVVGGIPPVDNLINESYSLKQFLPFIKKDMYFEVELADNKLQENKDYFIQKLYEDKELVDVKVTLTKIAQSPVLVHWFFDGEFEEDLSEEEQYILAIGMVQSWLSSKILREENLKQSLGNRDFKGYSNANMLGKLLLLDNAMEIKYRRRCKRYTYNEAKALN